MDIVLWIILGTVLLPFVILAIFLLNGKGAFLIAGYNTMSNDKKAQYDQLKLCRFAGWFIIALVLWIIVFVLGLSMQIPRWEAITLPIFFVGVFGAVIYANTGKLFHKKVDDVDKSQDDAK